MTVIPRSEIEENLVKGRDIDWGYFKSLKELDRQDGTGNYEEAMSVLKDKDFVSFTPDRNYLIINGFILEPKVRSHKAYFIEEQIAKRFRNTFHPKGLVARVIS